MNQRKWIEAYELHVEWLETKGDSGERMELKNEDLTEIDGSESNLTNAILDGCDMSNGDFRSCTFNRTSMTGVVANATNFSSSKFFRVDLSGAVMNDADFGKAKLEHVDLSPSDLAESDFKEATLDEVDFNKANLNTVDFRHSEIWDSDFRNANLEHADFEQAKIKRSDFREANLTDADFSSADLDNIDFESATIDESKFRNSKCTSCDFSDATGEPASTPDNCWECLLAGTPMHDMFEPSNHDVSKYLGIGIDSFRHNGKDYVVIEDVDGQIAVYTEESYDEAIARLYLYNDVSDAANDFWNTLVLVDDPLVRYAAYEETSSERIDEAGMVVQFRGSVESVVSIVEQDELDVIVFVYSPGEKPPVPIKPGQLLLFGKAEDIKTLSEVLNELNVDPEPLTSYGRKRGAVAELKRVTEPMRIAAFKQTFPNAFEAIKHKVKAQTIDPKTVRTIIDEFGMTWQVTEATWTKDLQRLSPKDNEVLQFNVNVMALTRDPEIIKAMEAIRSTSYRSQHPVLRAGELITVGWVRYSDFPDKNVILIEEVQSDFPTVRKATTEESDFRRQLETSGKKESIDKALDIMKPFYERFYEDALAAIFDLAADRGRRSVEMLTYKSKEDMGSPMNVYEKLPKRMGMRKTKTVKSIPTSYDESGHLVDEVWSIQVAAANPTRKSAASMGKIRTWSREVGFKRAR